MNARIIIPARYGSSRFPGKPLAPIAGKTLLQRVCEAAQQAAESLDAVSLLVATDDDRILAHAESLGYDAVMTPTSCHTGTDRIHAAIQQLSTKPDYVINMQGDVPLTPPKVISELLSVLRGQTAKIVTPVVQLPWDALDILRETKQATPFSGTTAIVRPDNQRAVWFSKNIVPAIRHEAKLREASELSPVFQHIGIYGYSTDLLEQFANWPPSFYEELEGLEQLRILENNHDIQAVTIPFAEMPIWRGVDTPEDLAFVENLLQTMNG